MDLVESVTSMEGYELICSFKDLDEDEQVVLRCCAEEGYCNPRRVVSDLRAQRRSRVTQSEAHRLAREACERLAAKGLLARDQAGDYGPTDLGSFLLLSESPKPADLSRAVKIASQRLKTLIIEMAQCLEQCKKLEAENRALREEVGSRFVQALKPIEGLLDEIGLHPPWVVGVLALTAQELMVKKRLDELGIETTEQDFLKLADLLTNAYKSKGLTIPLILMSISKSYRHIRSKLVHEGHKYPLSSPEVDQVLGNTEALHSMLFVDSAAAAKDTGDAKKDTVNARTKK